MNHQQEKFANKNLATNLEIGSLSPDFPVFERMGLRAGSRPVPPTEFGLEEQAIHHRKKQAERVFYTYLKSAQGVF